MGIIEGRNWEEGVGTREGEDWKKVRAEEVGNWRVENRKGGNWKVWELERDGTEEGGAREGRN